MRPTAQCAQEPKYASTTYLTSNFYIKVVKKGEDLKGRQAPTDDVYSVAKSIPMWQFSAISKYVKQVTPNSCAQ
jgi:hypothetical protein